MPVFLIESVVDWALCFSGGQWMQSPQGITGIPPGLEYMSALDQIIVKQKIEILECNEAFCLQAANCQCLMRLLRRMTFFIPLVLIEP